MKNKKILLFILCLPVLLSLPYASQGQGIEITSGGSIACTSTATIEISNGNFINDGTYTKGTEAFTMSGATTPRTISGSSNTTMNNLVISNTGGITTQVGLLTTNNLSIALGSKFTVDPIKQVTVNGTLTNGAGNGGLVIKSTVTGTASLIHTTGSVSGTVERYIAAADWSTWNDGWHFVSSPVSGHAITAVFTVTPANEYDFYAWSEKYNSWINFKNNVTPLFADADVNGSSLFELGKGYMAAYKTAGTKFFSGSLNVADVSVSSLTISSGNNKSWHLLGNPFTSPLTWYTDWTTSNIGGVANIWNEISKSYSPINAGEIIPAGNGFMVQVSSGTASLTIPAANRVHSAHAWYKKTSDPVLQLFAHDLDNNSFQESQLRVNPEATTGFDFEFDGNFLPGYAPLFYSVMAGENLMVNSLPELNSETVIPFHFIKNEGSNFSIEVKGIETLGTSDVVYLKDKKSGIDYNLSDNNIYSFASMKGDDAARFELHFKSFTGIRDAEADDNFTIHASNGILTIQSLLQSGGKVAVYDMVGRTIATGRIEAGATTQININRNTGVYIVSVLTAKGRSNTKIIVK